MDCLCRGVTEHVYVCLCTFTCVCVNALSVCVCVFVPVIRVLIVYVYIVLSICVSHFPHELVCVSCTRILLCVEGKAQLVCCVVAHY